MKSLEDKVAFITGAASGIGLELARACGAAGMKVMLTDVDDQGLGIAKESLQEAGFEVAVERCDVTDIASIASAAEATIDRFGKVHLLANNAGIFLEGGAGESDVHSVAGSPVKSGERRTPNDTPDSDW